LLRCILSGSAKTPFMRCVQIRAEIAVDSTVIMDG